MRLLVTGAAGMLGRDVVAAGGGAGHEVAALARADLDITDADAVRTAVRAHRPDAVINCAAWTDVDGAEASEAAPGRAAIVRSAWVFGPHGGNFVDTMRRVGAEREEVAVVDDQVGCPTYTGHLAGALVEIAERGATGVLHVAGGGRCSWLELAEATFEEAEIACRVRPQSTADLGRPAPRPAFSVLASTRDDAPVLPHWREGLRAHLARMGVVA
jgi:dTDP-4-dehydrorhamnose reductase